MSEGDAQFDAAAPRDDEFMELVVLHLEGRLTGPRRDRLNALLAEDAGNRDAFVSVCTQASLLASCVGFGDERGMPDSPPIEEVSEFRVQASEFGIRDSWIEVRGPENVNPKSQIPNQQISGPEPPATPIILDLSVSLPSSLSPLPSFVGGPVFSYMVATVILGVMLLGAWAYKITHYQQIVDNRPPSINRPEMQFVGQITGMVDCRWSDPQTETYLGASAPLGRRYALSSGLMQITYDSGAKVILEGPCTYEVESRAGGFLALGKLTATVVSGQWSVASAKQKALNPKSPNHQISKSPNPSPLSPLPSPLFSVRTPTAVVTDLGTEFGVEVDAKGVSHIDTYKGEVVATAVKGEGGAAESVHLKAGQTATIAHDKKILVRDLPAESRRFVRAMPSPASIPREDLALWLDPRLDHMILLERQISWIHDRGPKHRRLYSHYPEARPEYDAAAFGTGRPGLVFTNIGEKPWRNLQIQAVEGLTEPLQLTDRFHLFAVVKVKGAKRTILSSCNASGASSGTGAITWGVGFRGPGTLDFYDNRQWLGSEPWQVNTGGAAAQILETRFDRGRCEFFVNGTAVGRAVGSPSLSVVAPFYFGIHGMLGEDPLVGALGEVIIYRTTLSDKDRNIVGMHLQEGYGIRGDYQPAAEGPLEEKPRDSREPVHNP